MRKYSEKSNGQLSNIVNMVRGELTKLERATMSALVTIDVHARDVVVQMAKDGVSDAKDFKWLSAAAVFLGGRHPQGSDDQRRGSVRIRVPGQLVAAGHHPADGSMLSHADGAIHLNQGGAPAARRERARRRRRRISQRPSPSSVVFNCSDGLDYKAMGKFFKGLAASGAWACFDEFNRIELEVLSVVAQQVLSIQRAVAARVKSFVFEGVGRLIPTANVFITMNLGGRRVRSELPDNLKALFRDVAMMVPDYAMIAEIIMYSFGYLEARDMARKLVQTYRLCSEQLLVAGPLRLRHAGARCCAPPGTSKASSRTSARTF